VLNVMVPIREFENGIEPIEISRGILKRNSSRLSEFNKPKRLTKAAAFMHCY
jgi:hypothetical protein